MPRKPRQPPAAPVTTKRIGRPPVPHQVKCWRCEKVFATPSSLRRHMKKKFTCGASAAKKRDAERAEAHKVACKEYYKRKKAGFTLTEIMDLVPFSDQYQELMRQLFI